MNDLIRGAEAIALLTRLKANLDTTLNLPIRTSEMGLLILIHSHPKPVTSVEAASLLKVSKPMITSMVKSLVKAGYLEKLPDTTDKRKFSLALTAKSQHLVTETFDEYHKTMAFLQSKLGHQGYLQMVETIERFNQLLLEEAKHA